MSIHPDSNRLLLILLVIVLLVDKVAIMAFQIAKRHCLGLRFHGASTSALSTYRDLKEVTLSVEENTLFDMLRGVVRDKGSQHYWDSQMLEFT
jgi:hypothetical protein